MTLYVPPFRRPQKMPAKSQHRGVVFKSKSSKSLHQILKERQAQPKETTRYRGKNLQQSVLKLLDTHQNLDKLLQEIQEQNSDASSDSTINANGGNNNNNNNSIKDITYEVPHKTSGCKDTSAFCLEVESITSCLEHQATLTGVPISQLATEKCAILLYESTHTNQTQEQGQEPVLAYLNQDYRSKVELVVNLIKRLDSEHSFHRGHFAEVLNSQFHNNHTKFPPWLLWHLHRESVMPFDLFLTSHLDHPKVLSHAAADLANLVIKSQGMDEGTSDLSQQVFADTLTHFIQVAHPSKDTSSSGNPRAVTECVKGILDALFAKLIDAAINYRTSLENHESLLPMEKIQSCLSKDSCQQFAVHHITQLLCHNPTISVTDAINRQHEWGFAKASPYIVGLFKQLLIPIQETDAVGLLRRVLDQEEVNWQSTLIYTSTVVIYYPMAQQLIKNCITDFIEQAFESYEEDLLICAFLLVRQAANEGPHVFPSYASWFKETFSSSSILAHRKAFSFLIEFLTKLVPHETAVSLRAHVQNPPSAPSKCQEVLRDYMLLAKTRLSDLNESWQESGFSGVSKQTTGARSARPQDQARNDVDIAVESYMKNNRIPTNVLEASIFRRPYYLTHFLPALLTPRMLPDIADAKMKLIESLKQANKIPVTLYQQYEEACAKELNELLEGAFSEDAMEDCLEPLDALKAGLDKLKGIVVRLRTCQNNDLTIQGELTAQVTFLSDKLATALGLDGPPSQSMSDVATTTHIDLKEIKPIALHKEVAEIVVDAFSNICKDANVIKQRQDGLGKGSVQLMWAHQLVSMLSRFTELCLAIYHRVWMLLCQQVQSTSDDIIVGAACFLLFTHTLKSQFPSVMGTVGSSSNKPPCSLLEVISFELSTSTSQQILFTARFTSALLHLFLCLSTSESEVVSVTDTCRTTRLPLAAVEKFCFVIPRVCPEMRVTLDEDHMETAINDASEGDDVLLAVGRSIISSPLFKKLKPESKLSFVQWISSELDVSPHEDILTDLERHDYHQWAILCHFLSLPMAEGGCEGCHYQAVKTLINGLMDYETCSDQQGVTDDDGDDDKVMTGRCHQHSGGHSCWRELLQSLQELIPLVDFSQVDKKKSGDQEKSHGSWLLSVLHERLAKMRKPAKKSAITCFSSESLQIQAFMRIACCLPPYLLFSSYTDASPDWKDVETLSHFVSTQLRKHCMETWGSLFYLMTAHLVKGLVMCCQKTGDALLQNFLSSTPLLLASIVVHCRRIKPFIKQAYGQRPIPGIFQNIQDLYTAAEGIVRDAKSSPSSTWTVTSAASKTASGLSSSKVTPTGRVSPLSLSKPKSSSSSSSSSHSSVATAITFHGVTIATHPWLCGIALHEALKRGCTLEERNRVLNAMIQMFARDSHANKEICMSLLECVIAEEAWNLLSGTTCLQQQQQQNLASQTIAQHVALLIQLIQTPSVLQQSVASRSIVQLYPLVIMRSFLPTRSQMQPLLSHHPQLMEVLLQTHNALGELYCRCGGEPLQPTRGLKRIIKPDKGDILSTELMLSCSRFIQSCISVCPLANLRKIKAETLASCNDEIRAVIRRYIQDKR